MIGSVALAQAPDVPIKWLGTWTLDPSESKIAPVWGPGVPTSGVTVLGQTLTIAVKSGRITITSDTRTLEMAIVHESQDLGLDNQAVFKRIDGSIFEIILSVNHKALGNHRGENR